MKYVVLAGVLGAVGVAALILDRIGLLIEARKAKPPAPRSLESPEGASQRREAGALTADELTVMNRIYGKKYQDDPDDDAA